MASIEIPFHLKVYLEEKLLEQEKKTGFPISASDFTALAIREKMERQFTKPK
tara:strand:+ start:377 stop:532 length:156 start_codon:yes stop_codon:yes gene_type:complete